MIWGKVDRRYDKIVIVATGPSVRNLDMRRLLWAAGRGVHIIAVNAAINFIPVAHSWFTLDPSDRVRPLMMVREPGVDYYAAVPKDYGMVYARARAHRTPPEPGIIYLLRARGYGFADSLAELAEDKGVIHTGNSAWGALGLAYHMEASKIVLLGVDATQEVYWFGGSAPLGSLYHLPALFATAIPQLDTRGIEVVNASMESRVDCFTRMYPNDAMDWIIGI